MGDADAAARRIGESLGALAPPRRIGEGTEFLLYELQLPSGRSGLRLPRAPLFDTPNNRGVSARSLQAQEAMLADWAHRRGIPTARVGDIVELDGWPAVPVQLVPDDGAPADAFALGHLVHRMHQATPPAGLLVASGGQQAAPRIAERLSARYHHLTSDGERWPSLPPTAEIASHVGADGRRALLHMDVRRQNLRCREGVVLALFDWSNALVGPPGLEMGRLQEYATIEGNGLDFPALELGYADPTVEPDSPPWLVGRLDAAVMLAVVFRSVAADPRLAATFDARARALVEHVGALRPGAP